MGDEKKYVKPDYYEDLDGSINVKQHVMLRTDLSNYFDDCVDVLKYLTTEKKMNVIVITFDTNIRDIIEELRFKGADITMLRVVDSVSIISGKGTPPVQKLITVYKPDSFTDIEVYTNLFLKQLDWKNVCVVFLSLHKLMDYQNWDEIGVFMNVFKRQMNKFGVPEILVMHTSMNIILLQILSRYTDKVLPVRKLPIIRE